MVDGNGEKVQTLIAGTFEGYDAGKVKFFAKNGDATNFGCKGVFGHDLDWSEIYLENAEEWRGHPAPPNHQTDSSRRHV